MVVQRIREQVIDLHDQFYDIIDKSDFTIPTFLSFGAVFQLLSLAYLPTRVSALPAILWLIYRLMIAATGSRDIHRSSFTGVMLGKHIVKQPEESNGIVVMLLGGQINHPFGKLAPGMADVDVAFKDMWKDAEQNRVKYGFLGRTQTLADTSDNEGSTNLWITYWKDIKGLHEFAQATAHRSGWNAWEKGKFPFLGIMHELYNVPPGSYEAVYANFHKWGFGNTKFPKEENGNVILTNSLIPNKRGSTMFTRMAMSAKN